MGIIKQLRRAGHTVTAFNKREPGKTGMFPKSGDVYQACENGSVRRVESIKGDPSKPEEAIVIFKQRRKKRYAA